jgi:molybdenum cofactor guanylyltransferase
MDIITPVVLAGGRSQRMGRDKSFVTVLGRPMIEIVVEKLKSFFLRSPLIVTNRPDRYRYLGLRAVADIFPGRGPMGGIYSALVHSPTSHCFVFACDMPFLGLPLIEMMVGLLEGEDVVLPRHGGVIEPLHAIYAKTCMRVIKEQLTSDENKLAELFPWVRMRYVSEREIMACPPGLKVFTNLNTPADVVGAAGVASCPPPPTAPHTAESL